MSLKEYREKRDFDKTPEPSSSRHRESGWNIFVVQRHDATNLHFDFRLELNGVLKSWAVPKGPSMNPADRRLAVMVEDHPVDYAGFEGRIPEGQYGAGTVQIWDYGTWKPLPGFEDAAKALEDGHLNFELRGEKLVGKFALVRTNYGGKDNSWLLIKKKDDTAVDVEYIADHFPAHA